MHEKMHENKNKSRDKMVLPTLREENLAKILEENDKRSLCCLAKSEREEKFEKKTFEKVFESVKELFLKDLKHDVRLIEK